MSRELLQQALDQLYRTQWALNCEASYLLDPVVAILKAELAKPEQAEKQEPVAYIDHVSGKPKFIDGYVVQTDYDIPLYISPPRKEWVELTDQEVSNLWFDHGGREKLNGYDFAQSISAKLKEKNT